MKDHDSEPQDLAHKLVEAVHGAPEFMLLESDELAHRAEVHLDRIDQEMNDLESALRNASKSTQIAVSEALGDMRGAHARAAERLRELREAREGGAEATKERLAKSIDDLHEHARHRFRMTKPKS